MCAVCNNAWNRDSLDEILFLIFEIRTSGPFSPSYVSTRSRCSRMHAVVAIFFTMIAWAYYHQVLDPTSAANVSRTPANPLQGPPNQYPDHYNPPYDAEGGFGYNAPWQQQPAPQYAPPPGPPPSHTEMGYGVGMGLGSDVKDAKGSTTTRGERDLGVRGDDESETTKFEDPFADFDGPSKPKSPPLH